MRGSILGNTSGTWNATAFNFGESSIYSDGLNASPEIIDWNPHLDRRFRPSGNPFALSMGELVDYSGLELREVEVIPFVVPESATEAATSLPETIDRRDPPPIEIDVLPAVLEAPPPPNDPEDDMSQIPSIPDWSVGPGIDDVINWGIDIYNATQSPTMPPPVVVGGGTQVSNVPAPAPSANPPGVPVADVRNKYCYVWNGSTWVLKAKTRKRRRKRLATTSDIKDLAALKQVLGDGKNLQTWIATHG